VQQPIYIFLASAVFVSVSVISYGNVAVSIDKKFSSDGTYTFQIFERAKGPTGKYTRLYSFRAQVVRGITLPAYFDSYVATMKTERGSWRTHREPLAGYLFLFWKNNNLQVDIELIEQWDAHPVRMTINGIHDVTERVQ